MFVASALVLMLVAAAFLALFVTARQARMMPVPRGTTPARVSSHPGRAPPAAATRRRVCGLRCRPSRAQRRRRAVSALRAALAEANDGRPAGSQGPVTGAAFSPGGDAGRYVERRWDRAHLGRPRRPQPSRPSRPRGPGAEHGVQPRRPTRPHSRRRRDSAPLGCTGRGLARPRRPHGRVLAAAFSADGGRVVTASLDRTARIWDARSGRTLHVLRCRSVRPQRRLQRRRYACRDGRRRRDRAHLGRPRRPPAPPSARPPRHRVERVVQLRRHAARYRRPRRDGAGLGRPRESRRRASRHTGSVITLSFSQDGRRVVTAGDDGTARIWDASSGRSLLVLRGHTDAIRSATFSPTGGSSSRQATTGRGGSGTPPAGRASRSCVATERRSRVPRSTGGGRVVTAGADGTARVWDARAGEQPPAARLGRRCPERRVQPRRPADRHGQPRPERRSSGMAAPAACSAVCEDTAARLTLPSVPTGRASSPRATTGRRASGTPHRAQPASPARSCRKRVRRRRQPRGDAHRHARATTGPHASGSAARGRRVALLQGGAPLNSAAFSADGTRIVTAGGDGAVRIWNAQRGRVLLVLRGHSGAVWSAAFSPDGALVVSAGDDRTARIWDSRTGRRVRVPPRP